jgi:hypothetical protein
MGRACSTNGAKRNAYRILVGKPEGKRPLGRSRRRWVSNIKIDLLLLLRNMWLFLNSLVEYIKNMTDQLNNGPHEA